MLKAIWSYFIGKEEEISIDEAYSILSENNEEQADEEKQCDNAEHETFTCVEKIGYITNANDTTYTIDEKYNFKSNEGYALNSKVSYVLYCDELNNAKVSTVKVVGDDWTSERTKESKWCTRSLICKVVQRKGRNLVLSPHDLTIDLDTCSIDFVPYVGDHLTLEAKCMIDEDVTDLGGKIFEIIHLKPLRSKVITGHVRHWNSYAGEGILNQDIYFNSESLSFGYVPKVKDTVAAEAIESDQPNCNWRALTVVPNVVKNFNNKMIRIKDSIIKVSKVICLNVTSKDPCYFEGYIENESAEVVKLLRIDCISENSLKTVKKIENFNIPPNEKVAIEFVYENNGNSNSFNFIKYIFEEFEQITNVFAKNHKPPCKISIMQNKDYDLVRGQKVSSNPRFVEVRIPAYNISSKLQNLIVNGKRNQQSYASLCADLVKMKPSLSLPLSFNIYEDKFHTLLDLQEIKTLMDIEQYNSDCVCFIRDGEYLLLEVENLAERRPSLIIGDKIIAHDSKNKLLHEGFIHKVGARHLYLKFSLKFHELYNNEDYPITAEISRGVMKRMHHAVSLAVRKLGKEFLFPSKVITKPPQIIFTYDKYYDVSLNKNMVKSPMSSERLRNLLIKYQEVQQKTSNSNHTTTDGVLKLNWINKDLNYYQKEAVRNILLGEARPLPYIIFGPPGTGKTITLVETILQIRTMIPDSRILVATPSNSSSDLIATRLIDSNLLKPGDLIRLVSYKLVLDDKIPVHLVPYSGTINLGREGTTHANELLKNGLRLGCDSSVIGLHRITIGTCATLGCLLNYNLPKGHFTHIIIDEAGQAMEPEIIIPLSMLDVYTGQVVLAGDPMQLGPVINSELAIHYGLQESFLERLLTRFPYARDIEGFKDTAGYNPRLVTKLLYNYRCLPNALELYNNLFYNSELKSTISCDNSFEAQFLTNIKEILPNPYLENSSLPSIIFHGVLGENYRTPESPSWFNPDEASFVFDYVNSLYKLGVTHKDIGIITPYIRQVKYLRTVFNQAEFESPKIGSVEEFQGQEFNVIILSTVRSESKYISSDTKFNLGFITNPRRVNVAFSRAKCLTIIIGNPYILSTDSIWKTLIEYCKEKEAYCGCEFHAF